jgi:putative sugar O-methyltransferase
VIPLIVSDLETFGFENFRCKGSAMPIWVDVRNEELAQEHYDIFISLDNDTKEPHLQEFSESDIGKPLAAFQFNGRNYTSTSLSYLRGLVFLKKVVDASQIHRVMEIGGGYGALGEILLKVKPDYFYINVDLPPLAAVSTYYLQTLFGKEAILDYSQSAKMKSIDIEQIQKEYRGVVLCPWQLPNLKGTVELSVNFISFQEMEPDIVKNYANYIDLLTTHYVLLRNSRYGKPIAEEGRLGVTQQTTREHYLEFFSPFQLKGINSNLFGYQKFGFESEVMIFQKKSSIP